MDTSDQALLADLAPSAAKIIESTQGVLEWEWDPRFRAALAAFDMSVADQVRQAVETACGSAWSSANLSTAAGAVQELAHKKGGLRPGQLLYTTDAERPALLFCAWWVWGSGDRASLRIGSAVFDGGELQPDAPAHESELRSWFGV
jgi:hypothetical protein